MTDKQIQRIKTALGDPGCESVTIMNVDEPHEECATTLSSNDMHLFNRGESWLGEADAEIRIFSVKYNRRTYADLGVGDIVDTPGGEGEICGVIKHDIYEIHYFEVIEGRELWDWIPRHELILLEKASD